MEKIQSADHTNSFTKPKKNPFDLPPEIMSEIIVKNRIRRAWQRSHDPVIKRLLNQKMSFIKLLLRTHK